MNYKKILLTLLALVPMSGCSWLFDDYSEEYKNAKQAEPLTLPERVNEDDFREALVIPEGGNKLSQKDMDEEYKAPRPDRLVVADTESQTTLSDFKDNELEAYIITDGSGTPNLRINVSFARAWTSLGEALRKAEINVDDYNRAIGTYYLEITPEGEENADEEGCWAFCDEDEVDLSAYELKINRARSGVFVAVHKDADTLAEPEFAKTLLEKVSKFLK